jgi:hypothetical protein
MPDVDRFETKLRGKGWRSVYRLACSGAPREVVVDKIVRAVANVFRKEEAQVIGTLCSKVEEAVELLRDAPLLGGPNSKDAFDQLCFNLHEVARDAGYSELARLGERAAAQTFIEMEKRLNVLSNDLLRQHFMRNLVWALAQRMCLSPVRDGVMELSGREPQAQRTWEAEVWELLLKPCASLAEALLSKDATGSIRLPRHLFKAKPTTLETLHQPLRVLGESA